LTVVAAVTEVVKVAFNVSPDTKRIYGLPSLSTGSPGQTAAEVNVCGRAAAVLPALSANVKAVPT